jgi:hypothetical protein
MSFTLGYEGFSASFSTTNAPRHYNPSRAVVFNTPHFLRTPMLDIGIYFFILGIVARLVKTDLRLPDSIYEALSIYLLLAIGIKGGIELSKQDLVSLLPQIGALMALGFAIPFFLYPLFRSLKFTAIDSANVGAHFGSVSVVTFAVAMTELEKQGIAVESYAALWVAVMEAPGIIAGVLLASLVLRKSERTKGSHPPSQKANWWPILHDVLFGKSVLLLLGGIVIGATAGEAGTSSVRILFVDLFKPALCVFLLELGLIVGERLRDTRTLAWPVWVAGLGIPPLLGLIGGALGWVLGLSTGGIAVLATLAASASYIAAPTAMRIALPQANASQSITIALVMVFPFNVLLGIPLYIKWAQFLNSMV